MRDALAERLLAEVMGWTAEDVAQERPVLQAMASYKYDEYQQFSPGMRFVESFASWLSQFASREEKKIAYEFVMKRLLFCSSAEMNHLVSIAYPYHIRPLLLRKAAVEAGLKPWHVAKVAATSEFKVCQRRCLFLGLSDGARIDIFRRSNSPELSHEQMLQTYEISPTRVDKLLEKLTVHLTGLLGEDTPEDMRKFRTVVLLDDFSASGVSYLSKEADRKFGGKIGRFYHSLTNSEDAISRLVDIQRTEIFVVLYMATEKVRQSLEGLLEEMWKPLGVEWTIIVVHPLSNETPIRQGCDNPMEQLIECYYDTADETEHTWKGGTDLKYGFAGCGLPLVLSHNTPNNSVYLLWAESSDKVRALFPRVSRHRKEP